MGVLAESAHCKSQNPLWTSILAKESSWQPKVTKEEIPNERGPFFKHTKKHPIS